MRKKTVILGAGVTGLRIGAYLAEQGHEVTIIEKTPKVGGMCASFEYNGFILDYGPHKFYTQLGGVYDDFKQVLGEGNYGVVPKKNSIRLLGSYFDFPVKMSQLLTKINPILSSKILIDFIASLLSRKETRSYEDYFVKGFGRKGYEILFKGFAEKVWGNPAQLSEELARRRSPVGNVFELFRSALVRDKDMSAESFYYPRKGYGVLSEKLAEIILKNKGKILLSTAPVKIAVKNGFAKEVHLESGGKKKISCDVLVSSLSIEDLPRLLSPLPPQTVTDHLQKLKFRSLVIAYVFLNKPRALKDNWIFFPEREFCFNRVAEQKSFSPETGPADKTVITAEITCDYGDSTYIMSDAELKERIVSDLVRAGLIKREEVIDFITRRAGRVYPVYSLDYKRHLTEVLVYLDTISNLYSVGRLGLFNYNNADHCLDMARVTAEAILVEKDRAQWRKAREYFDSYRIVD